MPSVQIPTHTHSFWGDNETTVNLDYVTPAELDDANARNSRLREDMNSEFREARREIRKNSETQQRQIAELRESQARSDEKLKALPQDISAMLQEETGKWIGRISAELKPCYAAVQRQEALSQEVNMLRTELSKKLRDLETRIAALEKPSEPSPDDIRELESRIAALEKPSGPSPDDFRKLESRIAALEKPSGPSPDDIRELGNRIAALEKNRNTPGESSPVPSLSGTWRTWLARLFGKRSS